jgi:hypothetical protein
MTIPDVLRLNVQMHNLQEMKKVQFVLEVDYFIFSEAANFTILHGKIEAIAKDDYFKSKNWNFFWTYFQN